MMIPAFPDNPCAGGAGTVTSVGITAPAIFAVTNSPVTTAGVIDLALVTQTANRVFAGPSTGAPAAPTFRTLVAADLGTGTATVNTVLRGDLTWGDATAIVGWTPSLNTSSPNNTVNASRLLVNSTSVNGDAVIQPKGTGALLGSLPDGTATGGNKRGQYAVDLQLSRSNNTEIASGDYCGVLSGYANFASGSYGVTSGGYSNSNTASYSTISGGSLNLNNGNYGTIGGGRSNQISGQYGTVAGGYFNAAVTYASVLGGYNNNASGQYSSITGGNNNSSAGDYAFVGGGASNSAQGANSIAIGGSSNQAVANYSTVLGGGQNYTGAQYSYAFGQGSRTWSLNQRAYGNYSSTNGNKQEEDYSLYRATTSGVSGNTAIEITADGLAAGGANRIFIQNNATYAFWGIVVGTGADTAGGTQYNYCAEFKGVVRRINAATITLLGCPTVAVMGDDSTGKLVFDIQVDTTNNALQFIGQNNVSINAYGQWMIHAKLVKLGV